MDLVTALTAFPTVIFTILLGISLGYWLLVIFGAAGIDMFDGAGEGVSHGLEGVTGGLKAAGGAVDSVASGLKAAGSSMDGVNAGAKAAGHSLTELQGAKAGLFSHLGFGRVPVTISGSLILFFSFICCLVGMGTVAPKLDVLPDGAVKTLTFFLSLVAGTFAASVAVRPLKKVFEQRGAEGKSSVLGKLGAVSSLSVDAKQGTVEFNDGGAGFILHAVCEKPNQLKKGDPVVLVSYDPARDVYEVEPAEWLMPQKLSELSPEDVAAHARQKERG